MPITHTLYSYVGKDVTTCSYFLRPKEVHKQKSLGNTGMRCLNNKHTLTKLTHQCGKMSLTLIAELLYFSILVMAEIAFSVGLIFSGERDSGSVIISTRYDMASPHAPCRQKH